MLNEIVMLARYIFESVFLSGRQPVGSRVAVIGAGGIGYDVSEFLTHTHKEGEVSDV